MISLTTSASRRSAPGRSRLSVRSARVRPAGGHAEVRLAARAGDEHVRIGGELDPELDLHAGRSRGRAHTLDETGEHRAESAERLLEALARLGHSLDRAAPATYDRPGRRGF